MRASMPIVFRNRMQCGGVLLLSLVAFILRIHQIDRQELWFDEAVSYYLATITTNVAHGLGIENTPPLYFLLLRAWLAVAGTSETAIRLLSAIFGTFFVLVILWAGRVIFNTAVGWWSALFATVAPIHIYYSQEARAYALATLLVLLTYVLLWLALERAAMRYWLLAAVAALCALFTHYFTFFALLPTALLLYVWPKSEARRPWLGYIGLGSLCGLLILPWIFWSFVLTNHSLPTTTGYVESVWTSTPPGLAIPKTLEVLALGSQKGLLSELVLPKSYPDVEFPATLRLIGLGALALLGLWAVVPTGDKALDIPWITRRKIWLGASLLMPLGIMWLVSLFRPIYLVGRYDIIALPAYALLLGLGLAKLQAISKKGPWLLALVCAALFVPMGVKLGLYYDAPISTRPWPSSRETAHVLGTMTQNGDVVVFTGVRGHTTLYYFGRAGFPWKDGYCQAPATAINGRRFACRLFPFEWEEYLGVVRPVESIQAAVKELVSQRGDSSNTLWIAFQRGILADGRLTISPFDAPLVAELERLGYIPDPVNSFGVPGIVAFR